MAYVACIAAALLVITGLVFATQALRAEARTRFYQQYNQQQLLLASQASQTIEGLFVSFHRSLTLAARLLQWRQLTLDNTEGLARELQKVSDATIGSPIVEFVAFDQAGTVVSMIPEDEATIGRNYAWREYYRWALEEGRPEQMYLSPFMQMEGGSLRGKKALIAVEGLYDVNEELRGLVALLIDFNELARRHVKSIRIGKDGYAWLVDNKSESLLVDSRGEVSGRPLAQMFLPRWPQLYELIRKTGKGEPGVGEYEFEDPSSPEQSVRMLAGYAPIRIADRQWTLLVCTPVREVETIMGSLLRRQTILSAISIGATVAGALVLTILLLTWGQSLHREVEVRTAELTNLQSRLVQAQKMEAIGTLAGGIAHDFNNLLTPIMGYSQLAIDELSPDSEMREDLERVVAAGERAQELVAQILAFARKGEQERRPVPVAPLVKETLKLLGASLPATIEIHQRIEATGNLVLADPTQIHQLLMNLCTNAYQAIGEEPGSLDVELVDVDIDADLAAKNPDLKRGAYMRLTVTDTGVGMTPEVKERIFEPFYTTKQVGEGTGMGLSVVHGIVKSHEGALSVYSEPGQGTTFTVYLPKHMGTQGAATAVEEPLPRGTERILFVDDETVINDLARKQLGGLGYDVTIATDGYGALETVRQAPDGFDLLITDQTMPKMTGLSLIREVKSIRPDMPTMLCTGFSSAALQEKAKAAGVQQFVLKPLTARKLAFAVRRALATDEAD